MATPAPATPAVKKPEPSAKLKELADKRVPVAIERIRLVGNLASYKPTPKQADQIVTALHLAVKQVAERLHGSVQAPQGRFTLER